MATKASPSSLSWLNTHWPYLLILVAAFAVLWPAWLHPQQVLMQPGAPFSDLLISHWPNTEIIRQSLFDYHQFPFWNPSILGGAPLAADPLAGLWYPPNWLTIILPLPWAFNLLFALHLAWGGWGLYRWARSDGFDRWPALVGGLGFAVLPISLAHISAGHLSLIFAVSWTPWLLFAGQRSVRTNSGPHHSQIATTAAVWALAFLADVRWGVLAGLLLVIWWLAVSVQPWPQRLLTLGLVILGFLLLTAVLWLPLWQFVELSARAALTPQEAAIFSLPPDHLFAFIIPNFNGSGDVEYVSYLGIGLLALALVGIKPGLAKDRLATWTMLGLAFGAIWWALGPQAGLYWVASRLPGLALLRVPSRALYVFCLAVCWLAVRGVAAVQSGWRLQGRIGNLVSVAGIAALWMLAIGGSFVAHRPLYNLFLPALALSAVSLGLRVRLALPILLLTMFAEFLIVDATLIEARPVPDSPVAQWLAQQPGVWRVYSPSYSVPQLAAVQNHLQLLDGVNPLQLADTVTYLDRATGVPRTGYSVTVPPFDGDVATANRAAIPEAHLLGAFNVRFIASQFDIVADGLTLRTKIGDTRIYENAFDLGRVQGDSAELVSQTPNRVEVAVASNGNMPVTLAQAFYPGWVADVDGASVPVAKAGIFPQVTVGDRHASLIFEFRPTLVWVGLGLSGLGLVLALYAWRFHT